MPDLPNSLRDWQSDAFAQTLKIEIEDLKSGALPLQNGLSQGGIVDDSDISVSVINFNDDEDTVQAKVGVFFTEIVAGCSCGDGPMSLNAYCQMLVSIDKTTSEAAFTVIPD